MHRISKILTGMTTAAVIGAMAVAIPVQPARAQQAAAAQAQQKKYKDQGEYDIYAAVSKEQDWSKKLALLNTWKQKYPDTDFKQDRLTLFLVTYQNLKQFDKVMDISKEILASNPKDIQALYWISFLTPSLAANNPSADALDTADKAANGLLAAEKPAGTPDAAWATAKKSLDATAHKTLGWVAMVRKNNDVAQQEFLKSLAIDPNAGEVSYWLGTVLISQQKQKPELVPQAVYYFARAAAYDGPGALAPQGRQMVNDYLTKAYNSLHGADPSLDQIKTMAKANPNPPADFKIRTKEELEAEAENKLQQDNPALAMWRNLKKQLQSPDGASYFQANMKGASVPGGAGGVQKFKGKLIEAKPSVRSKELVVALDDGKTPEVTLKLNEPLTGKPEIGSDIAFEGVPTAFTADPFMVTFDVEKDKIEGLKVEKVAPARRPPARKSAAAHKKA